MQPEWIRRLANIVSRQIRSRQGAYEQAESWLQQQYPSMSAADQDRVATGATDIYHERMRRNSAGPNDPAMDPTFRDNGWQRPDAIHVTVQYSGPNGATRYRTLAIQVNANSTMADVLDAVNTANVERSGEYPGWIDTGITY